MYFDQINMFAQNTGRDGNWWYFDKDFFRALKFPIYYTKENFAI